MANFDVFLEKLQQKLGLEYFGVFYGEYRAIVTRNDDPEGRGRIQMKCPRVGHRTGLDVWVDPVESQAGPNFGNFFPPEVGSAVRVVFDNGNPAKPKRYSGGWFPVDGLPSEFRYSDNGKPERRGIVTRKGHALVFCDEKDNESIRLIWHKPDPGDPAHDDETLAADRTQGDFALLSIEPNGSIQIANSTGSRFDLDTEGTKAMLTSEQGHYIALDSEGVKISDSAGNAVILTGGEMQVILKKTAHIVAPTVNIKGGTVFVGDAAAASAVLGEALLTWLNTHQHPTGTGPSGFPIKPADTSLLSKAVKVKA